MSGFSDERSYSETPVADPRDSHVDVNSVSEEEVGLTEEHLVSGRPTTADDDDDSLWGFVHSAGRHPSVDGEGETGSMVMVSRGRTFPIQRCTRRIADPMGSIKPMAC